MSGGCHCNRLYLYYLHGEHEAGEPVVVAPVDVDLGVGEEGAHRPHVTAPARVQQGGATQAVAGVHVAHWKIGLAKSVTDPVSYSDTA